MIPVGSSFIFVEPIYLQAEASRLPQLQRVVAANGNQIVMEKTLPQAIDVLLGKRRSSLDGKLLKPETSSETGTDSSPDSSATQSSTDIADLINEAENSAQQLEQDIAKLRGLIDALQKALEGATE